MFHASGGGDGVGGVNLTDFDDAVFLTYTLAPQVFFGVLSLAIMFGSWLGGLVGSLFTSRVPRKGRTA